MRNQRKKKIEKSSIEIRSWKFIPPYRKFSRQLAIKSHVAKNVSSYEIYRKRSCVFEFFLLINLFDTIEPSPPLSFYGAVYFFSFFSPLFKCYSSPFARRSGRSANDCFTKRLGNAIFTESMRVTCHRVRAVTRRHSRGMAATQAKRFTSSVAGVASGPHFPSGISPAYNDG